MGDFKHSERFHVELLSEDGYSSQKVVTEIGLDGVFVLSSDGKLTLRKYPLSHISRWAARGTTLTLYTKTPVDVEERAVALQASEAVVRSALDTLTCCCMQYVPRPSASVPFCLLLRFGSCDGTSLFAGRQLLAMGKVNSSPELTTILLPHRTHPPTPPPRRMCELINSKEGAGGRQGGEGRAQTANPYSALLSQSSSKKAPVRALDGLAGPCIGAAPGISRPVIAGTT